MSLTDAMSIVIDKILAASPTTTRGQPTQLSTDPKGERIAYAVSGQFPNMRERILMIHLVWKINLRSID
jgi:hypothetical protein